MKALIYYRKSTDRDDKQVNSLEHQLTNCRNTAKTRNFEIIEEIGESQSAKTEYTRPGFNRLIDLCSEGITDFIIIDEPKRLSRNNIDTSRIVDLMDKNHIKGIIATSREYRSNNSRDKFLLQLDLSLSKMDNEDRALDTRNKMITCLKNGRWMGYARFGYKNITIRKGHKDIVLDEVAAPIVREIFDLRIKKQITFEEISKQIKAKYPHADFVFSKQSIQKIITCPFYYGIMSWGGQDFIGAHTPIVSKQEWEKANQLHRGFYQIVNKDVTYPLK